MADEAARGGLAQALPRRIEKGANRIAAAQRLAIVDLEDAVGGEKAEHVVESPTIAVVRVARHQVADILARGDLPRLHRQSPPSAASTASTARASGVTDMRSATSIRAAAEHPARANECS
jgi:hypothetical protein